LKLSADLRQHYRVDGNGGFKAKRSFTEEAARLAGARMHKNVYKCPVCGGWHLGGFKQ
jgi:hypothetical protein